MIAVIILSIFLSGSIMAQTGYQPSEKNLQNREWFQDAKFGLFIHWGLYCQMAGGGDQGIAKWIMNQKKNPDCPIRKTHQLLQSCSF